MSKIKSSYGGCKLAALAMLLAGSQMPGAPARADNSAAAPGGIKIASCTVSSTRDPGNAYDCSAEAAKDCNGRGECEIPIGYNLTAGKDIEPGSGLTGKRVTIKYDCGDAKWRQRGPYYQNDHATLILECLL